MKRIIFGVLAALCFAACTSNYGKKVKDHHIEVYYKEGISKEDAEKTARLLYDADVAAGNQMDKKSVQLTKNGDTVNFRMVAVLEKLKDIGDDVFMNMANILSDSIFPGKPVNVDLTDNRFSTIRTVRYKKVDMTEDFGTRFSSGSVEVYATGEVSSETAEVLANALNEEIHPGNTISFQFDKNSEGYYVVRMVTAESKLNDLTDEQLKEMSKVISDKVLGGAPLVFELTDAKFHPARNYTYDPGKMDIDTTPVKR